MKKENNHHWVFRAHVADKAGALTSIASAFSNESINIDTIVGHGSEENTGIDGTIVLTFFCTEDEKDIMVRKVKRLSKVTSLEEHRYDSNQLRKSAIIKVTRKLVPRDVAGQEAFLTCETVERADKWTYFIAGSPTEIDLVLKRFGEENVIEDIVYSIIGL